MVNHVKNRFILEYANKTDRGMVRSENQDFFGKAPAENDDLSHPGGQLFIVADGMGGHERGREASETAVNVIIASYFSQKREDIRENLKNAMQAANQKIYQLANSGDQLVRMGTTCSALVLSDEHAYIGHVGDSRVYRIDAGGIEQLTQDHTQVAEMFRKGILSEEEAAHHPSKSVLVRALGVKPTMEIDLLDRISLRDDDHFVLCSDGLGKVEKEDIRRIVLNYPPAIACEKLIDLANQLGGRDNITVQVIRISRKLEKVDPIIPEVKRKKSGKWLIKLLISMMILLLLALGYYYRQIILQWISDIRSGSGKIETLSSAETAQSRVDNVKTKTILDEASQLIFKGDLDRALKNYLSILRTDPMNLAAVNGITRIAQEYKAKANNYQSHENYQTAIEYYQKALALQPKDQESKNSIEFCETALQNSLLIADYPVTNDRQDSSNLSPSLSEVDIEDAVKREVGTIQTTVTSAWEFYRLSANDYEYRNDVITFLPTNQVKKSIFKEKVEDVDVEVTLEFSESDHEGRAGILLGYQSPEPESEERYFLFSVQSVKNFLLEMNNGTVSEPLLSIPYEAEQLKSPLRFQLKVKCLGPWIMLYHNQRILKAWLNKELIRGKVGLFADPGIRGIFSQFRISPVLVNNQPMVDEKKFQE